MNPLVSVIITARNSAPYINQAIDSVFLQDRTDLEMIVVDDGSTDETRAIVQRYGSSVKYTYQPHSGGGIARNTGIKLARAPYFAFLDSDDLWLVDKIELQLNALENFPETDFVFTHIKQFLSPDLPPELLRKFHCPEESIPGYAASTILGRVSSFLKTGEFSGKRKVGEFIEWFMLAQEKCMKMILLPQTLVHRRIHLNNTGSLEKADLVHHVRILKAALDRRRSSEQR